MNCIAPPELSDAQLWTYVDGESPPPVLAHLARCQHCYARAMHLARLSGRLKLNLYRLSCPTPIELGDYQLGMLEPVQAGRIARHLDDCPLCSAEIARLSTYLEQLAPEIEGNFFVIVFSVTYLWDNLIVFRSATCMAKGPSCGWTSRSPD